MTIASGVFKDVAFKVEPTWNTPDSTKTGAQYLRRVTSTLNLVTASFESAEIRSDAQVADFRIGSRHVEGTISGELSGGSYQTLTEAMLRADAAAVADITGLDITIADVANGVQKFTGGAGTTFITDGLRTGMVIRLTAGDWSTGTTNRNLAITSITSETELYVYVVDGGTKLTPENKTGATINVPGAWVYVPTTNHTNYSYAIEEWHSDISLSRLFTGCKPTQMAVGLPATGMSTIAFNVLGGDCTIDTSQYYTTPAAPTTSGIAAAPQGAVLVQGAPVGLITGMNFTIVGGHTTGQVIGSRFTPDVFVGRVRGTGQMTVYLQDETYLNYYNDETEVSAIVVLRATSDVNTNFIAYHLPRIKFSGGTVDDGEKGLIVTMPFNIVKKATATGYESTTIMVQDSLFTEAGT